MKIWTNGCFDVLHRGHLELFRFARFLGDELIVGIDTDDKVKKDKGHTRPINNLQDRMFMLQSLRYVDKVIPFNSTTELERTLKWLHPSVMVIGSDWRGKKVIGEKYADKLIFFDRVGHYSTSEILHTYNDEVDWTLQTR